jgi:hypothetical protein
MEKLISKLKELQERDFTVVSSRGSLSLQQTQRNQAKAEILDAIYEDVKSALEDEGYDVYITSYGPVIEFLNPQVEEQVLRMDKDDLCSGFVSVQLDAVMKNLDTNGELDEESYLHDLEEKELRKAEKDKAKKNKTQRDAEVRAEKARQREEAIARIQARKE